MQNFFNILLRSIGVQWIFLAENLKFDQSFHLKHPYPHFPGHFSSNPVNIYVPSLSNLSFITRLHYNGCSVATLNSDGDSSDRFWVFPSTELLSSSGPSRSNTFSHSPILPISPVT